MEQLLQPRVSRWIFQNLWWSPSISSRRECNYLPTLLVALSEPFHLLIWESLWASPSQMLKSFSPLCQDVRDVLSALRSIWHRQGGLSFLMQSSMLCPCSLCARSSCTKQPYPFSSCNYELCINLKLFHWEAYKPHSKSISNSLFKRLRKGKNKKKTKKPASNSIGKLLA